MWGLLITISIFWFLVHLSHRTDQESRRSSSLSTPFNFSLTIFVAKLETERFNQLPFTLLDFFGIRSSSSSNLPLSSKSRSESERSLAKRFLSTFYHLGIWFALGASVASVCIIAAGLFQLLKDVRNLVLASSTSVAEGDQKIARRSEPPDPSSSPSSIYRPTITPLIPGITLPLWHLPLMVIALFLSQVIHEAGHAIAGALNGLKPLRMGILMVFPILPGAFVVLPEDAFEIPGRSSTSGNHQTDPEIHRLPIGRGKLLKADSQLSILAAGVWHNMVSFVLLNLLLWTSLLTLIGGLCWKDAKGMSIRGLDSSSPLASYLTLGDTVTALDDLSIEAVSTTQRERLWTHFLLGESFIPASKAQDGKVIFSHWSPEQQKTEELGWCMDQSVWQNLNSDCCEKPGATTSGATEREFCFVSSGTETSQRCLDPLPLVNIEQEQASSRCVETCSSSSRGSRVCIRPDPSEELVRIRVIDKSEISKVVLFQGSREAIHSALEVSPLVQKWWFLPLEISQWLELTTNYFLSLSLALALLNMLPLPHLDGDAFLTIAARKWMEGRRSSVSGSTSTIGMERRRENATRGTRDVAGRFVEWGGIEEGSAEVWLMRTRRRIHWLVGILAVTVLCGSTLLHIILGE